MQTAATLYPSVVNVFLWTVFIAWQTDLHLSPIVMLDSNLRKDTGYEGLRETNQTKKAP